MIDQILAKARELSTLRESGKQRPVNFAILVQDCDLKLLVAAIEMLAERCKRAEDALEEITLIHAAESTDQTCCKMSDEARSTLTNAQADEAEFAKRWEGK